MIKLITIAGCAILAQSLVAAPVVRTDINRNATTLNVGMQRIGVLKQKSVYEVGDSAFMLDGGPLDRDFVNFDKYSPYLEALGVKKIRVLTGWAKSEKERGKIDVAWLDHIVDWCKAHGMEAMLELSYGNPIYPGAGGAGLSDGIPNTPEGLAEWDRWVEFLAVHFKDRTHEWAMWNEPDNKIDINTPEMIAAFNVRSAKILRKHIPNARIHGLSLAGNSPKRLEDCLKPMGDDVKLFDTFIYHGYVPNPDCSYHAVERSKKVLAKYAPHAALRQGENGAPSDFLDQFALQRMPWSEVTQAKYDMRRALGDIGHDVESGLFTAVDIHYRPPTYPFYFANRKGYLRTDVNDDIIQIKRTYYAMQNVVGIFNHDVTRVKKSGFKSTDRTLSVFEYKTKAGEPVFVFWNRGPVKIKQFERKNLSEEQIEELTTLDSSARPSDSFETRESAFDWNGAALKEPVWVDLMTGWVYAVPAENQIPRIGGFTFVRIPTYDSPCVLTEKSALTLIDTMNR